MIDNYQVCEFIHTFWHLGIRENRCRLMHPPVRFEKDPNAVGLLVFGPDQAEQLKLFCRKIKKYNIEILYISPLAKNSNYNNYGRNTLVVFQKKLC